MKIPIYFAAPISLLFGCGSVQKHELPSGNIGLNVVKIAHVKLDILDASQNNKDGQFPPLSTGFQRFYDGLFQKTPAASLKILMQRQSVLGLKNGTAEIIILEAGLYQQNVATDFVPLVNWFSHALSDRSLGCSATVITRSPSSSSQRKDLMRTSPMPKGAGTEVFKEVATLCQSQLAEDILKIAATLE
jgi:hypothetical protein